MMKGISSCDIHSGINSLLITFRLHGEIIAFTGFKDRLQM